MIDLKMFFSKRWELMFIIASGLFVAYTLRVNMSVAADKMAEHFVWSDNQKGLVLSAFFWGETIGQLPISIFCQIYGAKWVFGLSILMPSILTLFVPAAAAHSFGMALFIRFFIGLWSSGTFPSIYFFFRNWIPNDEKTIMIPVVFSGMYLGEIVAFPICGVLVQSEIEYFGGWESTFYLFGLIGLVWFPIWAIRAFEHPTDHPHMTEDEVKLIKKGKHPFTIAELDLRNSIVEGYRTNTIELKHSNTTLARTATNTPFTQHNGSNEIATITDSTDTSYSASPANEPVEFVTISIDKIKELNDMHKANHVPRNATQSTDNAKSVSFLSDDEHALEIAERTPWMAFFKSLAFWTLMVNSFMADWTATMLLTELPSFLTSELGFSSQESGILSMPPYVALFISVLVFGPLFEHLQLRHHWKTRTVRLWSQIISLGGSALCLLVVVYCDDVATSYGFLILAQFLYGAEACGVNCGYMDVSPNFSFSMNTLGNTMGSIAGLLAPVVVGLFTTAYSGMAGWQASFLLTFFMSVSALVMWYFCAEPHVIHDLNTPTPKHIDVYTAGEITASGGSDKVRIIGSKGNRSKDSGSGKYRTQKDSSGGDKNSKQKNSKAQPTTNPMLLDQLL